VRRDGNSQAIGDEKFAGRESLVRISICILCHNYGRYLGRAIESCLDQEPGRYRVEEILVFDDGSTDDSAAVASRYGDKVRVITASHRGFGPTLSAAIAESRGDWIALLDADDWFAPEKLRTACARMTEGRLLVEHYEYVVDADGALLTMDAHPGGNTSTLLVDRTAALGLLPVSNELFFHLLADVGRSVQLREPLTYYRVHADAMTDRVNPGVREDYMAGVCREIADRLASMAAAPPVWAEAAVLARLRHFYLAEVAAHQVEAALQRGQRLGAWSPLPSQFAHAVMSGRSLTKRWPSFRSATTGTPCIRLGLPAAAVAPLREGANER
jgi:glycosyltransferase involved in cell wall biosynthesis